MHFLWPSDGPRAGVGSPEAFVLFVTTGGRTLALGSNLAYEVWLDGVFAGDGGHRCVDGHAALDTWDATRAERVLVRVHWIDPTRTINYSRRGFTDPFVAVTDDDPGAWTCALDDGVVTTPTKASGQLPRQHVVLDAPRAGAALSHGFATLSREWECTDFGLRRTRVVACELRPASIPTSTAPALTDDAPFSADDLAAAPITWAKDGLPSNVTGTTYDLGRIALHRVEVTTGTSPALLCWGEVPAFADTWTGTNRIDVRLVDAIAAGVADGPPFGWRGGRYLHVLHRADDAPTVRAWCREYPLDWRTDVTVTDPLDRTIVDACRANLVACVDGGIVDTCWRERGQWTGDLRMSALALRVLAKNDEVVTLALRQLAASYVDEAAMVQAVWPATLPDEPLFIPGYHLSFCLTAIEHGVMTVPSIATLVPSSLAQWRARYLQKNGLLGGFPPGCWWFVDWDPLRKKPARDATDADAVTHAWFNEVSLIIDDTPGISRERFDAAFWTGRAYRLDLAARGEPNEESPQATAAAVLAFRDSPHREAALDWLEAEHAAGRLATRVTPYFAYFVARALGCRSRDLMRAFIHDVYGARAARWGTIPEKTDDRASLAHGWSIGVAALLV